MDDIEKTRLPDPYDGVAAVLVLQHIDWKKGLDTILGLKPSRIYLIEQGNLKIGHAVTKGRFLPPSVTEYVATVTPQLVPLEAVPDYLAQHPYRLSNVYERPVPDDGVMVGMVFAGVTEP
ncbi:MAG: hypothetical protein V1495_08545 [Pseudomonadota bacterium]